MRASVLSRLRCESSARGKERGTGGNGDVRRQAPCQPSWEPWIETIAFEKRGTVSPRGRVSSKGTDGGQVG
jgi:hypothetical protein